MNYQGHIEDGVVVFDQPVPLPNGTEVRVEPVAIPRGALPAAEDFWRERSIDELIVQQRAGAIRPWTDVFGQGATLWDDDAQCDDFLRSIHDRRHEGIAS